MGLYCTIFGHKWNGCKCVRCGFVSQHSNNHHYVPVEGKCQLVCSICGKKVPRQHKWVIVGDKANKECIKYCEICGEKGKAEHKWNKCICERCGAIRKSEHDFHILEGECIEKCSICGTTRPIAHKWAGDVCINCHISKKTYFEQRALEAQGAIYETTGCDIVGEIEDQTLLQNIANNAKLYRVRSEALKHIIKREILISIAQDRSKDYDFRIEAANKIKDDAERKKVLASISMSPGEQSQYDSEVKSGL
ncbi:MAG: hypothetical protein R2876_00565 [Eubacteriales bacterium]